MKNNILKITLLLTGGFLFNLLFWGEKPGINLLLFTLFIFASAWVIYKPAKFTIEQWLALAGALISSVEVVWLNTEWAFLGWLISFVLLTGLLHQPALRSVLNIIPSGISTYLTAPLSLFRESIQYKPSGISKRLVFKTLQVSFLPLIIFLVFYFLYQSGNSVFETLSNKVLSKLSDWISHIFDYFSFSQFLYFLSGLLITAGVLISSGIGYFAKVDRESRDSLTRGKRNGGQKSNNVFQMIWEAMSEMFEVFGKKMLALKTEYVTAVFTLVSLNILLLIVNIIDIIYLWINFQYKPDMNLSAMTHDGINMLIVSIVLAMIVLIYFFRGNLNFYGKNKTLRVMAIAWLAQNLFLACSAFMRDYHYIERCGLTYKRMGIIVYVTLTLVGLCTMYIKIRKPKTLYYLLRVNAWAAFMALILMSSFDWDKTIVEYNIHNRATIYTDISYLASLSYRTLPNLLENEKELKAMMSNSTDYIDEAILNKKKEFEAQQKGTTWLSWNHADHCTKGALKNNK